MSIDELKALFENGDKPTAADYGALIDEIFEGKGVSQADLDAAKTVLQKAIDTVKTDLEGELTTAKNSITALEGRVSALENAKK